MFLPLSTAALTTRHDFVPVDHYDESTAQTQLDWFALHGPPQTARFRIRISRTSRLDRYLASGHSLLFANEMVNPGYIIDSFNTSRLEWILGSDMYSSALCAVVIATQICLHTKG